MNSFSKTFIQNTFALTAAMIAVLGSHHISKSVAQENPAETTESVLVLPGNPAKLPSGISTPPKVLLISGDDEYRSEEALPMLAQILSEQHGMDCVVSFSINPECNCVDPTYHYYNSGLEHLKDADVVILFTRFRAWPDEQMKLFEDYVKSGKPMIALRTATHPFNFSRRVTAPISSGLGTMEIGPAVSAKTSLAKLGILITANTRRNRPALFQSLGKKIILFCEVFTTFGLLAMFMELFISPKTHRF